VKSFQVNSYFIRIFLKDFISLKVTFYSDRMIYLQISNFHHDILIKSKLLLIRDKFQSKFFHN